MFAPAFKQGCSLVDVVIVDRFGRLRGKSQLTATPPLPGAHGVIGRL